MRLATTKLAIVGVLAAFAPACVSALVGSRVVLKSSVTTRNDVVNFSEFLPFDAPDQIRILAARVSLAAAPLPGERRNFRRDEIVRALKGSPELGNILEVPLRIEVTRWSRTLSAKDVADAIRETLRANGVTDLDSFADWQLTPPPGVFVTEDTPTLKVTRMEPTQDGAGTRVRVWVSSEPRIPPFWVKLDFPLDRLTDGVEARPGQSPHAIEGKRQRPTNVSEDIRQVQAKRDSSAQVKVGELVELVIQGHGLRISTSGVTLNSGSTGQSIRIRSSTTGKILIATIVSAGTVEIDY